MAERIGPFLGLDAGDAVELGELLAFLSLDPWNSLRGDRRVNSENAF